MPTAARFADLVADYPAAQRNAISKRCSSATTQQPRRRVHHFEGRIMRSMSETNPLVGSPVESAWTAPGSSFDWKTTHQKYGMSRTVSGDRTDWMTVHPNWSSPHAARRSSTLLKGKRVYGQEAETLLHDFGSSLLNKFGDVKTAFKVIDLNGNGQISGSEFAANVRQIYKGDVTAVFKVLDADCNGTIGWKEFQKYDQPQREKPVRWKDFVATRQEAGMPVEAIPPKFGTANSFSQGPESGNKCANKLVSASVPDRPLWSHGLAPNGVSLNGLASTGGIAPIQLNACPTGSGSFACR